MITPSLSLTATERVLPKLALDFTTASLDNRITFTRTTGLSNPATYVNSSGVVTAATNNQPRFDYDPVTLACKGLLIEESRTNLLKNSDQISNNGTWARASTSVTANAVNSPDGTQNADTLIATASAAVHDVEQSVTITAAATQTFSVYVKAGTNNFVSLFCYTTTSTAHWFEATYNLSDATVSKTGAGVSGTYISSSLTNVGNGWYRAVVTGSIAAGTSMFCGIKLENTSTPTYGNYGGTSWTASGTESVYLYGAQLEAGAFATSYIPTTTAALTRNADVATMTGTNFSDWFNASEGTLSITGSTFSNADRRGAGSISDGTTSNCVELRMVALSSNNASRYLVTASGAASCSITASTAVNNTTYSLVGSYKTDSFAFARGGALIGTDSLGAVPTVNQFKIGTIADGSSYLNGHVQKISYWPQQLTTAEVTAFSK